MSMHTNVWLDADDLILVEMLASHWGVSPRCAARRAVAQLLEECR